MFYLSTEKSPVNVKKWIMSQPEQLLSKMRSVCDYQNYHHYRSKFERNKTEILQLLSKSYPIEYNINIFWLSIKSTCIDVDLSHEANHLNKFDRINNNNEIHRWSYKTFLRKTFHDLSQTLPHISPKIFDRDVLLKYNHDS